MASDMASTIEWDNLTIEDPIESPPPSPPAKKVYKFPGFWKCPPVNKPIFASDRHHFKGGPLKFQIPNPNDTVYWAARTIVQEFHKDQPFQRFANQLHLSALNWAPTVFSSNHETEPVVHALFREGMVVKLQLELTCDIELGWSSSKVLVRDDDRWISLRHFLTTLPRSTVETTGQLGYWIQHRWWKSMAKPFRLMDLPVELQDQILLSALGEKVFPTFGDMYHEKVSITEGTPKRWKHQPETHLLERVLPTNLSVLCLSRDLAVRTKSMMWNDTVKVFQKLATLEYVCRPSSSLPRENLRRMQLSLTPTELIKLFNVDVLPFRCEHTLSEHVLLDLPSLDSLVIDFSKEGWSSAWYEFQKLDGAFAGDWEKDGMDLCRAPCQRVFVDMVMAFAAPYLRNIKTIRLTGWTKTSNKREWEQMLNRTAFVDNESQIEARKKTFADLKSNEL